MGPDRVEQLERDVAALRRQSAARLERIRYLEQWRADMIAMVDRMYAHCHPPVKRRVAPFVFGGDFDYEQNES